MLLRSPYSPSHFAFTEQIWNVPFSLRARIMFKQSAKKVECLLVSFSINLPRSVSPLSRQSPDSQFRFAPATALEVLSLPLHGRLGRHSAMPLAGFISAVGGTRSSSEISSLFLSPFQNQQRMPQRCHRCPVHGLITTGMVSNASLARSKQLLHGRGPAIYMNCPADN